MKIKKDSPEVNEYVGKCPKCQNKVTKNTKNGVIIKCSQCGHTFLNKQVLN